MTSHRLPLTGLRLSLVGPGNVGSSLAHWAVARGATLSRVAGRSRMSAEVLTGELSGKPLAASDMTTADDDVLIISVDDSSLGEVITLLSGRQQAPVVLHTSGRNPATALRDLQNHTTSIGSVHPLKAFPRVLASPQAAAGVVFGYDGDPRACEVVRRLIHAWGGVPVEIPGHARSLYHLAATAAAGGVVTLVASALELADDLGLDPRIGAGYLKLAEEALALAASSSSIAEAITGPVARGDLQGFATQLADLRPKDPELATLLELLARRTLKLQK
jgi:predicted short-subunit dehydrogenase-like oxidoreductase (DUF2520 family)